jgi:hypothetical protein
VVVHFAELVLTDPRYHRWALVSITLGFGGLTIASAAGAIWSRDPARRRPASRVVATMSLFLFAMSFLHLGGDEVDQAWSHELLVHHAGIPLALFVLLQDYRFVLLDAFIRFLANILLAAGFTFLAVATLGARIPAALGHPTQQALLLAAVCLLFILFAMLRSRVQQLLTRGVFRRPELDRTLQELRAGGEPVRGETEYLGWAEERLAEAMGASSIQDAGRLAGSDLLFPTPVSDLSSELRRDLEAGGVEAVVPLRFSPGDVRYVLLGRRVGGRRYLSEDLQALARLAAQIVERVEEVRESEMRRLVSQAELRALQSQIHPHFLFNALNALYGVIPKEAAGARRTVVNLADIFRYFLQSDKTYIPLEEELRIVNAYLEIESLRLGPKLRTEIHVDEAALRIPIPILSIQPLVENAVKHGVAAKAEGGVVRLDITLAREGLQVSVEDTGGGFASGRKSGSGVGLENVTRRLRLCFGPEASLQIESTAGGARVHFLAPVHRTEEAVR